MPENTEPDYVGIDIAAERLDYCVNETTEGNCTNDHAGRSELIAKVKRLPRMTKALTVVSSGCRPPLACNQRFCADNRRSSAWATPQVSGVA